MRAWGVSVLVREWVLHTLAEESDAVRDSDMVAASSLMLWGGISAVVCCQYTPSPGVEGLSASHTQSQHPKSLTQRGERTMSARCTASMRRGGVDSHPHEGWLVHRLSAVSVGMACAVSATHTASGAADTVRAMKQGTVYTCSLHLRPQHTSHNAPQSAAHNRRNSDTLHPSTQRRIPVITPNTEQ